KKADYKGFMACLTGNAQEIMAGWCVISAAFMDKGEIADKGGEIKKKLPAVLAKYGVTREAMEKGRKLALKSAESAVPPDDAGQFGKAIKDKVGFVGEISKLLDKATAGTEREELDKAELKDLKITGNRATATIVHKPGERKEPVVFIKDKDGW